MHAAHSASLVHLPFAEFVKDLQARTDVSVFIQEIELSQILQDRPQPRRMQIGHAAAKAAALTHAGVSESQVYDTDVELDDEDGRWVYEVEFKADGMEYEYVIDAYTSAVLEYDMEQDD